MWKPKLKSCLRTRKLLCKALCLVLFCSFAPAVNAQLTQAQIQQAFYDALMQWGYDTSGEEGVPYVFAIDDRTLMSIAYYLDSQGGHTGVGFNTYQILRMLYGDRPEFWNNLRSIVQTNAVTDLQLASEFNELERQLNLHLPYLDSMTYTPSSELRVHDDGLNALVSNMVFDAGGLGADMSSSLSQLIGISQDLAYIRGQFEAEAALDVTGVVATARAQTEQEYQDALDEAMEEAGDIPLPTEQDDYETEAADAEGSDTSDIFGGVSTSVTHSSILQLVPRTRDSSLIPEIEIDFGRIAAFETFCQNLNVLTDWLYPLLGTLFLSLKGVGMWKKVRQASTIASASGESPVLSLDWRPF